MSNHKFPIRLEKTGYVIFIGKDNFRRYMDRKFGLDFNIDDVEEIFSNAHRVIDLSEYVPTTDKISDPKKYVLKKYEKNRSSSYCLFSDLLESMIDAGYCRPAIYIFD